MKYSLRDKLYQIYDLLNVPSATELLKEPEIYKNIQTNESYVYTHGGKLIEKFNNYIAVKSSRNNKIYIVDPINLKILDEFIFFKTNEKGEQGNILFDFRTHAIVAKERNKYYLINENLEQISKTYKLIRTIIDLNYHLLCKNEDNTYVLVDISGNEKSPIFKDLMEDHGMGCHWFKNNNDLFGIMEITDKIKIKQKPIFKQYEKMFGGKFKCIDINDNEYII